MHQELFLAVSFVTVQYELSGSVICYYAICPVSGNVWQYNFYCAIRVITGKLCLAVSHIVWQYELFLAASSVLPCTRSYIWQCQLLLHSMSYVWQCHLLLWDMSCCRQHKLLLSNMSCFWQHLLHYGAI